MITQVLRKTIHCSPHVHVANSFQALILHAYPKDMHKRGLDGVGMMDLKKLTNDKGVLANLKNVRQMPITPDQINDLLDLQGDIEEGDPYELLGEGSSNVFYVSGVGRNLFAVKVYRKPLSEIWIKEAWTLNHHSWPAGTRVFFNTLPEAHH